MAKRMMQWLGDKCCLLKGGNVIDIFNEGEIKEFYTSLFYSLAFAARKKEKKIDMLLKARYDLNKKMVKSTIEAWPLSADIV
ncbi:MAG: hypothetical protein Q4C00_03780, partial [Bacillota bacterium]|nr:hypothetical protein [Bacillota bacterium]